MENREDKSPETGREGDISKSQAGQQPGSDYRQSDSPELSNPQTSQAGQSSQSGFGGPDQQAGQSTQADYGGDQQGGETSQSGHIGTSEQGDTSTRQRSDIEGTSAQTPEKGEAESGFIGTQGSSDTSSELVEDQDYASDGQGAPEGK